MFPGVIGSDPPTEGEVVLWLKGLFGNHSSKFQTATVSFLYAALRLNRMPGAPRQACLHACQAQPPSSLEYVVVFFSAWANTLMMRKKWMMAINILHGCQSSDCELPVSQTFPKTKRDMFHRIDSRWFRTDNISNLNRVHAVIISHQFDHLSRASFISQLHRRQIGACTANPGGGTPIYGLYRYVPWNRVWFLRFSVLK